jgi:hypothetical protein
MSRQAPKMRHRTGSNKRKRRKRRLIVYFARLFGIRLMDIATRFEMNGRFRKKVMMNHISAFSDDDYSVVVKNRAPLPNPWRWEIYRAGRASPMECSAVFFCTVTAAHRAGKAALKQLMGRIAPNAMRFSNADVQSSPAEARLSSSVSASRPASVIRERRTRFFAGRIS